ncbi:MAG: maleylpyruvate isomerase family mycothiol-dependent enzyme, partial [Ilumatobacteraceae bacterium]
PSAIDVDFRAENPADDDLSAWFVAGHHALVEALRAAPVDLAAFTFLADPPAPRVFWARRQLHETGMHRVDAESALGRIAPFSPEVAADGIDEMLTGFVPRSHTPLHSDVPVSLQVTTTDAAGAWRVTISADPPVTERIIADAMCSVAGPASDVHRALWNRGGIETLAINGDAAVLRLFCDSVKVTWS